MPKVYTHFDRTPRTFCESGKEQIEVYQEEIKEGRKQLTHTGYHNVYREIQIDLDSCKIENILHQVAMGDLSALKAREATYVDTTNMPKTLMEAQNLVIRIKDEFDKMPMEVKKEFGNSADKYVELMGTEEFNEIMAPYNKKIADIAEAGSIKEYQKKVKEQAKFEKDVAAAKGVEE